MGKASDDDFAQLIDARLYLLLSQHVKSERMSSVVQRVLSRINCAIDMIQSAMLKASRLRIIFLLRQIVMRLVQ